MNTYLKAVKSGDRFRFVGAKIPTVYKAVLVRTGISQTTVEYIIPGLDYGSGFSFTKPSLTSVVIIDTPEPVV